MRLPFGTAMANKIQFTHGYNTMKHDKINVFDGDMFQLIFRVILLPKSNAHRFPGV